MECLPWMEGGVWQQILWRAVRVGDLVHTECFRGISWSSLPAALESSFGSVLQCADWFLLVGLNWKVSSRSTPKKVFSWRATQEPKQSPEAPSMVSPGCLLFVQVCCCCAVLLVNKGRVWVDQISPGSALAGTHTAGVRVDANLDFKVSHFSRRKSTWNILSVFWYSDFSVLLLPI